MNKTKTFNNTYDLLRETSILINTARNRIRETLDVAPKFYPNLRHEILQIQIELAGIADAIDWACDLYTVGDHVENLYLLKENENV